MDGHGHSHSPRLFSREVRIGCMLLLTGSFFFVEIVVGYLTHSLALIADSFHMLSDVIALIIAITAIRMAKRPASEKNTYGWQRAELLGALVNSVFLLAMCLSIFIEAVQRFFDPHLEINDPAMVLWVGAAGLAMNVFGLVLMSQGHGHSHGGHSHDHDGAHNTRALILHLMSDALGSLAVVISSLTIWLSGEQWANYLDPVCSVVIVVFTAAVTVPLVKSASVILMQGVPLGVGVQELQDAVDAIPGVVNVHELHIWQLTNTKMIASVHIVCSKAEYHDIAQHIKRVLHHAGVHSSTIQPEFIESVPEYRSASPCQLPCSLVNMDTACQPLLCCDTDKATYGSDYLGQGLQAAIDADDCSATGSASVEFSKHVARPSSV